MSSASDARNVAIVGSHHAGKTTLVEAILAHCGAVPRRGTVVEGTTTTDFEPECIAHAESTCVGFAHAAFGGIDLTLVDCPGFVDFFEETKMALMGCDAAIVVLEGDPARVPQTAPLLEALESRRMPHLFVIDKIDRPGADFEGTLRALQEAYGRHVVAEQWPIGSAETFSGYVDLADRRGWAYDGTSQHETAVPEHLSQIAGTAHDALLEAMADFDDRLMEELLDGREPSLDEIERDLIEECRHDQIVPVLVAAGLPGFGTSALIGAIERWFPAPADAKQTDAEGRPIAPEETAPLVARVIKTIVHPQAGKLSVVRVISGTMKADATLTNMSKGAEKVRSGGLYRLQGKKQEPIAKAGPGSIVAIARLESVSTGDTLTDGCKILLAQTPVPEPVFAAAVKPKDRMDEAKISQMLARIIDEDPALSLARAPHTNELLLMGSGEQHVGVAVERLTRKFKVEVLIAPPAVPYRETIGSGTQVHSRYKHQTGGHGQFADVSLRVEPRPRGNGVTFEEQIVGGVVPRQFIPAVEKGVREALGHGSIAGYPVTDVHVVLFDGAYHDVDSSEQAFKTAAGMAIRDALPKCSPVVLEPILRVAVRVPAPYTSAAIAQLTAKRGQILGMRASEKPGEDIVEADVPQVELARYITELRTATHGLGTYCARHERFDPVPGKWAAPKAAV